MSNDRFLKNTKTGQVVRWNPHLQNKIHLVPYTPPWMRSATPSPAPAPDTAMNTTDAMELEDDPIVISDTPVGGEPDQAVGPELLPKDEADLAVKQLFGKDVSKVPVIEMTEMAQNLGADIPWEKPTKLQLITAIVLNRDKQGDQGDQSEQGE